MPWIITARIMVRFLVISVIFVGVISAFVFVDPLILRSRVGDDGDS